MARDVRIARMQDAIKISINDDLLFGSGDWEPPAAGKASIAKVAAVLAPDQTQHVSVNGYTDSTLIIPGLMKQGVTSNQILSQGQSRFENVPSVRSCDRLLSAASDR